MLAIVIPYYKRAFFEQALASLANQTDKRFKVYIGDDNSPESPLEILEEYRKKIELSYKRFDTNFGNHSLVGQWERCLALCSDEKWVMVLGDDDMLGEDCVAEFYKNLDQIEQHDISVIRFATAIIDENGTQQSKVYTHPEIEKSTDFIYNKEIGQTRSSLGEYIFRHDKLTEKGFADFPLAWHSDDMAILQCSGFGNIFSLNQAVVYIRVSALSISGNEANIAEKKKATFLFYSALAFQYARHFTKKQQQKIIGKVEQYFYKQKSAALLLKIARWHTRRDIFELFKFVRRIYKN
jgi:glycosyltransferase involved in cell wall biosynthesis